MRVSRIAMLALLVGIVACTSFGQGQPYGQPPGNYGQDDPYSRQQDYGYDNDQGPDRDVGFFYNELSPYGEWVRHPHYGWTWFPRHVRAGWRPYSLGRWMESDYGWTWVSDEPFGWATYHYGRWAWDPYVGWLWVPGTDWGPAWVAWQQGNGYVGWAPLPPQVGFEFGVGIRLGGFSLSLGIAPRDYTFVHERRFLHPHIGGYILPQARNTTIIHRTRNTTNYTVVNNRVINRGVPIEHIEQVTGRRAPRLRVATAPNSRSGGVQRDVIKIYRPTESKLETVRVARRNNAGLAPAPHVEIPFKEPPPNVRQPAVRPVREVPAPIAMPVAPRIIPAPRITSERQFTREQKDLKANQEKQQRALDQIHRQELAAAKAKKDNAQEVAQRHAAELQAQQEQRKRAAQQLQVRQQLERQAAQASEANAQRQRKAQAERVREEKKDNDNKKRR